MVGLRRAGVRALVACACACACGAPRIAPDTQGTALTAGPCGRGLLVVESDYQSSNVSLLGFDGTVQSPSLISSSTQAAGFGVGLSGDVVPPLAPATGADVVLIDRYPAGVLRFVELATARVSAELSVGTGFASNPHDYLPLTEHKSYVARYELNPNSGLQPYDQGGDILVVDPALPLITGRIDLTPAMSGEAPRFSPHPARLVQAAGRVFALLAAYADDYSSSTTSRLVELDPVADAIVSTLTLDGLHGCDALARSADESELAIACTGDDLRSTQPKLTGSGLALVDIAAAPRVTARFDAVTFGANPVGFAIDYAAPGQLLFSTLGHFDATGSVAAQDSVLRLDIGTARFDEVLQSEGVPFSLGDVRCAASCGACFVADAQRSGGSVLRFAVDGSGALGAPVAIRVETRVGLPPRYLGEF